MSDHSSAQNGNGRVDIAPSRYLCGSAEAALIMVGNDWETALLLRLAKRSS